MFKLRPTITPREPALLEKAETIEKKKTNIVRKGDFTKALYFLDGKVANDIIGQYKKDDTINAFLTNPSSPAVDIDVEKVALQPMQAPPYRASVDFYRVEYAPADHSVLKKTLYTANFIFLFKDDVPNELIPINPLGLTITYFRQDQAFTNEVQR